MSGSKFKPGVNFRDGKLYIFSNIGVTVVRPWPDPLAWRKTRTKDWHMVRPELRLDEEILLPEEYGEPVRPLADQILFWPKPDPVTGEKAWRKFCEAVPYEVRKAISLFNNRQYHIMAMIARCPGVLDLIDNNPALAYCLASNWVFHKPAVAKPLRAARALVRKRQREILEWLGFPGTESARKIFRKIPSSVAKNRADALPPRRNARQGNHENLQSHAACKCGRNQARD